MTIEDLQKRSEKGSDLTIFEGKPSKKPSNLTESGQKSGQKNGHGKRSDVTISDEEQPKLKIPEFLSKVVEDVYRAIKLLMGHSITKK